jgi:hypothetical protein
MTPSTLTPITPAEAMVAGTQAYQRVFVEPPSRDRLCMVVAPSADETARWKAMHNNNAGNMRGRGTAGTVSIEGASEVIDGHEWFFRRGVWSDRSGVLAPADIATQLGDNGFAAYRDPVEGFEALIRFLGTASHPPTPNRFAAAWDAAERGDVPAYCHGLKHPSHGGAYYTADEGIYTRGVQAQFDWLRNQFFAEQRQP